MHSYDKLIPKARMSRVFRDGKEDGHDVNENISPGIGNDEEITSDDEVEEDAADNDVDALSCQEGAGF